MILLSFCGPAAGDELYAASRSRGQTIGGSCPVAIAAWLLTWRFAVTLIPPREERYYQSVASRCRWARSIPHHYSPPALHHHTTCHGHPLGFFECVQLKGVRRRGRVSHSSIYIFISHFAAF